MLCTFEIILFLYLFSVFCLFLVKNTFGLRFHFRLDRLLGQNIPLSLSLCALVTRLEISIAITASVYSLLLTKPNKEKINSLLVKVKLFFNKYRIIYVAYPDEKPIYSAKFIHRRQNPDQMIFFIYSKENFLLFNFV